MDEFQTIPGGAAPSSLPSRGNEGAADPAGEESLSYRLPLLLNRAVLTLLGKAAPFYSSLGLSIPAARAIISLYESHGEASVGALAERTSIDLSTMSHILRRLEKQGLLTRRRHPQDNRIVRAALTDAGRGVAEQCHAASLRHEKILLGDMSAEDALRLKQLLVQVYRNAQNGFA
jgi:MarR family transcriptional regulator, organic hydroperoxide resistance regulator